MSHIYIYICIENDTENIRNHIYWSIMHACMPKNKLENLIIVNIVVGNQGIYKLDITKLLVKVLLITTKNRLLSQRLRPVCRYLVNIAYIGLLFLLEITTICFSWIMVLRWCPGLHGGLYQIINTVIFINDMILFWNINLNWSQIANLN